MITTPKEFFPILGKKPWKVWKGIGSFLLFEFGPRQKNYKESERGSHTLWIYMATWSISRAGDELAHSESSDARIGQAAMALTGQKLEAITLDTVVVPRRVRYAARLYFEGHLRLNVFMYDRAKRDAILRLYTPRTVISYNDDGVLRSQNRERRRA